MLPSLGLYYRILKVEAPVELNWMENKRNISGIGSGVTLPQGKGVLGEEKVNR